MPYYLSFWHQYQAGPSVLTVDHDLGPLVPAVAMSGFPRYPRGVCMNCTRTASQLWSRQGIVHNPKTRQYGSTWGATRCHAHPWLPSCQRRIAAAVSLGRRTGTSVMQAIQTGKSQGSLALGAAPRPFRRRRTNRARGRDAGDRGRRVEFETAPRPSDSHVDDANLVQTPQCRPR